MQAHLDDTQKKLTELRTGRGEKGAAAVITEQQRAAIDDLEHDMVDTRSKLRLVQFELRRDISQLETELRLFNIVLVPALLTVLAIAIGLVRRQKRARARA